MFYFFSSKQGREKNLPAYNGKFRNPSVRLDRIHRLRMRIESRSCIESFSLWLVRVVDTATTPRQPKRRRRRWRKNSSDRQIKRQKNAVSFFVWSLSLDCLSMHICPQIQHECKQTDLWKKKKKNLLICGAYELMELRISVTTTTAIKFGLQHSRQGQIEEGAERRAELPPPPQREAQGPTLRGIQVPFWNANFFCFRSHFRCLQGYS